MTSDVEKAISIAIGRCSSLRNKTIELTYEVHVIPEFSIYIDSFGAQLNNIFLNELKKYLYKS